jgi:hypothetical protein
LVAYVGIALDDLLEQYKYLTSQNYTEPRTSNPLGIKRESTPSANRSPSRSTCVGGATFRPFRLSTTTGGHALLNMMGVSRVGLEDRFEDSRLGGLNVVFSCSGNGVLLLSCDALCSGKISSTCSGSVLCRFGLSLRCDSVRFRFGVTGSGAISPGGGDGGK